MATSVNNPTNAPPLKHQALPFIRRESSSISADVKKDVFNTGKDYVDEGAPLFTTDYSTTKFKPYGMMTNPLVLPPTREEMEALARPDETSQTQIKYMREAVIMDIDAKLIVSTMDQMKKGQFREAHYPTMLDYMASPHYKKLRESRIVAEKLVGITKPTKLRESGVEVAGIRLNPRLVRVFNQIDGRILKGLKTKGFDRELTQLRESLGVRMKEDSFSTEPNWDGSYSSSLAGREPEFTPLMAGPFNKQLYWFDYLDMHSKCYEAACHNPVAKRIIKVITQFVLGKGVKLTVQRAIRKADRLKAKQDTAQLAQRLSGVAGKQAPITVQDYKEDCQSALDEHWMKNSIHIRSKAILKDLLTFGEQFIRYFDAPWGLKIRQLDPSTIWEVVTDPDDCEQEFYIHQQYPCVHGKTRILLLDGRTVSIKRLVKLLANGEEIWVYSYSRKRNRVVPGKVEWAGKTGKKRCVKVTLDNGKSDIVSYDHPYLMRDNTYRAAEDLKAGDSLMPLYRKAGYEKVWQPEDGKWEYTHQVVAKEVHGWKKNKNRKSIVDHQDENPANNHPSNVRPMNESEHRSMHLQRRWSDPFFSTKYAERLSLAAQKREAQEHMRRRRVLSSTEAMADPEVRDAIGKANKENWQDPKVRAKRIAGIKRGWAKRRENPDYESKFNHKVVSVEPAGKHFVYDLTIEKYHNFALASGVFTHNTRYQWYVDLPIPTIKFIIRQVPANLYFHMKINSTAGEVRGRSELFAILGWLKRLKEWASDRVVRNKMANLFILDIAVEGDASAVATVQQQFSQTPATPGSFFFHNKAAELKGVGVEIGANDASGDWEVFMTLAAMGAGLSKEYLGMSTDGGKAGALVGTEPDIKSFEDMQEIMEQFFLQDAQRLFQRKKERKELPYDLEVTVETTYPSLAEENRSEKLKDFAFGESMSWWSHRRVAAAAAKEMQMTSYDYDEEQKQIANEDAMKEVLLNTAYQQVTKGVDNSKSATGAGGTSSGSSGRGASGMGMGRATPGVSSGGGSSSSKQSDSSDALSSGEDYLTETEGEDEDTAPGTAFPARGSTYATTHNASVGDRRTPWEGRDVDAATGRRDAYRGRDPRDVSASIKREAANLRYERREIGRQQDRIQTPNKVRDQRSMDRSDILHDAKKALKSGNLNKEAIRRFPREAKSTTRRHL